MYFREFRMTFKPEHETKIEVWADCYTADDCDQMIAWLQLAKATIQQWKRIDAKVSRAPKAATSKNENPQQGKVLSAA